MLEGVRIEVDVTRPSSLGQGMFSHMPSFFLDLHGTRLVVGKLDGNLTEKQSIG
jgi:hypothetical protein